MRYGMSIYLSWSHTIALTPFQMFFKQIWQQSPGTTARVISVDCTWLWLEKDCDLTLTWLDLLHDLTWLEWSGNLNKSSIVILSHRHNLWHVWPRIRLLSTVQCLVWSKISPVEIIYGFKIFKSPWVSCDTYQVHTTHQSSSPKKKGKPTQN